MYGYELDELEVVENVDSQASVDREDEAGQIKILPQILTLEFCQMKKDFVHG